MNWERALILHGPPKALAGPASTKREEKDATSRMTQQENYFQKKNTEKLLK